MYSFLFHTYNSVPHAQIHSQLRELRLHATIISKIILVIYSVK